MPPDEKNINNPNTDGERLARIEQMLSDNAKTLQELKDIDQRIFDKLDGKADSEEINQLSIKLDDLSTRETKLEVELESLKNLRKNDFWWFSAIAACIGMVVSVIVVVIAAFIQK